MKVLALLSVLAVGLFFSGGMVKLSQASNSALNSSNALHIILHKDVDAELGTYFYGRYPKEFATCMYGDVAGNYIEIYNQYYPAQIENEKYVLSISCREWYRGHRYLGLIHSHPNEVCELSDADMQLKEFLMGVSCGDSETYNLAFYSSIDNYSNKYYAEVI